MELLGVDESVIATLTPGDQFVDDDPTQQSTKLKLPEDECVGCAVGDHSGQTLSLFWYSQATGHVITLSLLIPLLSSPSPKSSPPRPKIKPKPVKN